MPSYPKNYPFYSWMPKPLGIIILLFFFLPILTVGGVYSVNSTEMMSGLGIISEHIQFANFVTSIGMAAFAPFLYQLVCVRREKMMCIVGFAFMYIFSYICAKTDSVFLLALCSLLTGFLRMVLMMVNLFTLIWYAGGMEATRNITPGLEPKDTAGWNKLDIERCVSQPAVYLFFMILGQSGTALTAWLSFEYEWKYVYYFMMGILLISILLLFITMPNYKFPGRFPINFRKFGNVTAFCISLTCLTYVLVYGKVLDWYDDESIRWATAVSILFAGIFLYMDVTRRSPYVLLDAFKLRTIRMGALLYLLLMVINSSAMFVNVFAGVGMHLDNLQNASLGNWCMVGYAIGAVIAMVLGGKGLHFKYLNIEDGLDGLRYNKVIVATDADVDGMHIRLLLITFFLQFFPDLIKKGHVYILQTPLFRVRNKKKTIYCYSEEERVNAINELSPNPEITRFKGLGEISPDEFKHFIGKDMRLEQVSLRKTDAVKELLEFYMGKNTMERQNFIIDNLVIEEDLAS